MPYNGVLAFNSISNQYIQADSSNLYIGTGGSGRIIVDTNGHTTMPHQPAFMAIPTSAQNDFAINTSTTMTFGTEVFDQNADFTSNVFTAPITGRYQINVNSYMMYLDTGASYVQASLITSNRNYYHIICLLYTSPSPRDRG